MELITLRRTPFTEDRGITSQFLEPREAVDFSNAEVLSSAPGNSALLRRISTPNLTLRRVPSPSAFLGTVESRSCSGDFGNHRDSPRFITTYSLAFEKTRWSCYCSLLYCNISGQHLAIS